MSSLCVCRRRGGTGLVSGIAVAEKHPGVVGVPACRVRSVSCLRKGPDAHVLFEGERLGQGGWPAGLGSTFSVYP